GQHHRLSAFLRRESGDLPRRLRGVPQYHLGFLADLFDRAGAGGTMREPTTEAIAEAAERVREAVIACRPLEPGFPDRVREVGWRAQPYVLDAALAPLLPTGEVPDGPDNPDGPMDR